MPGMLEPAVESPAFTKAEPRQDTDFTMKERPWGNVSARPWMGSL